jgi:hypothetical protein
MLAIIEHGVLMQDGARSSPKSPGCLIDGDTYSTLGERQGGRHAGIAAADDADVVVAVGDVFLN